MGAWRRTTACERAQQWISLDLDGELDGLAQAGLARHLDRCGACRVLRDEIAGFTALIREAPAIARGRDVPVSVQRSRSRRHLARRLVMGGALAASVAAAAVASLPQSNQPMSAFVFLNARQEAEFTAVHNLRIEPLTEAVTSAPVTHPTRFRPFTSI